MRWFINIKYTGDHQLCCGSRTLREVEWDRESAEAWAEGYFTAKYEQEVGVGVVDFVVVVENAPIGREHAVCYVVFIRMAGSSRWLLYGSWDAEDWESIPGSPELKTLRKMGFRLRAFQIVVGTEYAMREVEL